MDNIKHRLRKPMERFWSKVKQSPGCWEWQGKTNNKGYGVFRESTKSTVPYTTAHRTSYKLAYGSIPPGKWILHHCDNRRCVRPDHLFAGTALDNTLDMYRKGRGRTGIGPKEVREIRKLRAEGVPRAVVGARYGISPYSVKNITMGRTWKHV